MELTILGHQKSGSWSAFKTPQQLEMHMNPLRQNGSIKHVRTHPSEGCDPWQDTSLQLDWTDFSSSYEGGIKLVIYLP